MTGRDTDYWDAVAATWDATHPQALWRTHSDAVNLSLLARWLPKERVRRLLKTDVFDEAFGEGLIPLLMSRAEHLVNMDVSLSAIGSARKRYPRIRVVGVDVRSLPFSDDTFDIIVSTSTLDHFLSRDDIMISLRELYRVLRPGGQLILTLDNPANPVVALRNVLPFRPLYRLGVLPYFVGATAGPCSLPPRLRQIGFGVEEVGYVLHCPRLLAVPIARILEKYAVQKAHRRFLRVMMAFEHFSHWPTRFFTGHYIAVRAAKPRAIPSSSPSHDEIG
jgi:SAM-dependent methyltransferase